MTERTTYGLHPSIWRALRRKSGGTCDIPMRDHSGRVLFEGYLYRYESRVIVPTGRFFEISWRATLKGLPTHDPRNRWLTPTEIPIGHSYWL